MDMETFILAAEEEFEHDYDGARKVTQKMLFEWAVNYARHCFSRETIARAIRGNPHLLTMPCDKNLANRLALNGNLTAVAVVSSIYVEMFIQHMLDKRSS